MTYSSWDKERDRLKLVILGQFLQFYPPKNKKYQNSAKMKNKSAGDIILQMCTKNHNHTMYSSWDTKWDGQNFLSFWAIFCPFTPQELELSKFWKIEKKHHEISSFYTCVPKFTIIWCMLPKICSALAQKTNILKK